eukprot:12897929-Prorocentrum_lima.AAC.1
MHDVRELDLLPPARRERAALARHRVPQAFRANTYSTWRPSVATIVRVFTENMEWPLCSCQYVTEWPWRVG